MNCNIESVIIRELKQHDDSRGWLIELFRNDEIGSLINPAMSYVSMTKPGVTRGPHEHHEQTDFFCFIGPSIFRLYLWDNRPNSSTYNHRYVGDFGENNKVAVIIPPGIVHAYKNIGECNGLVYNSPNKLYAGINRQEPVDEIRYENNPNSPFVIGE
jgi:dTDP-4-dehydrorhamnose 3,5-epimerase